MLIVSIVCLPFFSNGQSEKLRFGFKISPQAAWLKSDTKGLESDGMKLLFAYGVMADYNFAENYTIATGLDINYRGGKLKSTIDSTTAKASYNIQYIEVPVAIKLKTNEVGYMRFFGQLGFTPGYVIKARTDIDVAGVKEEDKSIIKDVTRFNISLQFTAGMEYNISGKTNLYSAIFYNNGFIDLFEDKNFKAVPNNIGLQLGVFF